MAPRLARSKSGVSTLSYSLLQVNTSPLKTTKKTSHCTNTTNNLQFCVSKITQNSLGVQSQTERLSSFFGSFLPIIMSRIGNHTLEGGVELKGDTEGSFFALT